jgi:exopolysaccharide production protein ExoZ
MIAVLFRRGVRLNNIATSLLILISIGGILLVGNFSGMLNALPEDHIVNRVTAMVPMLCLAIAATMGPQVDPSKTSWRAVLLAGDMSYSLYLIHPFILRPLGKLWAKFIGTGLPVWSFTILGVFAALSGGLILYWIVERPLTNFFAKNRKHSVSPLLSTA